MDIVLGILFLVSLVSLEYGSMIEERPPLAFFLILSLVTLAFYWLWFLYLKHGQMESEASKEVGVKPRNFFKKQILWVII